MALNPHTLNHLYEKGILDYVPIDLGVSIPMGTLSAPSNPYLDMAMQGGLYQNSINSNDTFSSGVNNFIPYGANGSNINPNPQIGSLSNAGGMNTFNGVGVGTLNNNSIATSLGFGNNIGVNSNAGVYNSFLGNGVGEQYQGGGLNIFGGFADTQNGIRNSVYKTAAVINNTPKFILGLISSAIGLGTVMAMFKRGKKPSKTQQTNFVSKLNPLNWFKKKN